MQVAASNRVVDVAQGGVAVDLTDDVVADAGGDDLAAAVNGHGVAVDFRIEAEVGVAPRGVEDDVAGVVDGAGAEGAQLLGVEDPQRALDGRGMAGVEREGGHAGRDLDPPRHRRCEIIPP